MGILAGIMNSNGYFGKKNEQKWVFWQVQRTITGIFGYIGRNNEQ